jgi:hypothetical protein
LTSISLLTRATDASTSLRGMGSSPDMSCSMSQCTHSLSRLLVHLHLTFCYMTLPLLCQTLQLWVLSCRPLLRSLPRLRWLSSRCSMTTRPSSLVGSVVLPARPLALVVAPGGSGRFGVVYQCHTPKPVHSVSPTAAPDRHYGMVYQCWPCLL